MIREPFWRALADFLFPPKCPLCGKFGEENGGGRFCSSCLAEFISFSHPLCPRCGRSFATPAGEDHLCGECLTAERFFTRARSLGPYEGKMVEAIARFKYRGATHLGKPLGKLLAEYKDDEFSFSRFQRVIPVPLNVKRLRQRGFNQSLLLTRQVARGRALPLDFQSLQRIRNTPPQTQLSGADREKNIRGAFAVTAPEAIAGKHILLIDDVFTTGATVQECAKMLKKAGAEQVDVLTLARA